MDFYIYLLALIPPLVILIITFFCDRYEREPIHMLFLCAAGGVLIALPILCLYRFVPVFDALPLSSPLSNSLYQSFISAALIEEAFKLLMVVVIIGRSVHFNEPFDGVVYYVAVAVGFAVIENMLYISGYSLDLYVEGREAGRSLKPFYEASLTMAAVRAIPAHSIWAVISGYCVSRFRFSCRASRGLWLAGALFYGMVCHGVYNFMAEYMEKQSYLSLVWLGVNGLAAIVLSLKLIRTSPFKKPEAELSLAERNALRAARAYGRASWVLFGVFSLVFMLLTVGVYTISMKL